MKQIWKNKWLMLLGGMTLLGGLSGCGEQETFIRQRREHSS